MSLVQESLSVERQRLLHDTAGKNTIEPTKHQAGSGRWDRFFTLINSTNYHEINHVYFIAQVGFIWAGFNLHLH